MTTATFNPWPFTVSVAANGAVITNTVPNTTGQATTLAHPGDAIGNLIWESLVRSNTTRADAIRTGVSK